MGTELRVLMVEDSSDDAELVELALRDGDYDVVPQVVAAEAEYLAALDAQQWDLVLCDHNLPGFDSIKALRLLQERGLDVPFIVVSGAIGEETAVAAMKAGASDYVMKDKAARLVPAVERELREAEVRRERRRAEEALRFSQARLSGIVASAMDAIISIDEQRQIVLFNPAAETMFGYPAEEVGGRPFDMLLPERLRDLHMAEMERLGMTNGAGGSLFTLTALRKSGEEFPIEATVSQIDLAGQRYYTAIVRDVTERVRAEEQREAALREKELLVREVHHRVKNNLQVVYGLLSLQAAEADPISAQALLDAETRVRAMGLVHDRLHLAEDVAEVDFDEYLHSFVPQLVELNRRDGRAFHVEIDAEGARFNVDIASPLALIVNELVTNALKHAFHGQKEGRVAITARVPQAKGDALLTVRDNGVGMPADVLEYHASLGLKLVTTLAEQLNCRVRFDAGQGTTVSLIHEGSVS